jgi:hypothetical protein
MSQSSWIAAFLFIGFVVFITIKGQLPQFQAAIFGGTTPPSSGSGSGGGGGGAF